METFSTYFEAIGSLILSLSITDLTINEMECYVWCAEDLISESLDEKDLCQFTFLKFQFMILVECILLLESDVYDSTLF